jgi:GT2 family glycosyltransferase
MVQIPKVFIVILNFNSYEDTAECIKSIKNIDYSNYEIIVIDNNSVDESVEKIKHNFKDVRLIVSESNKGYASGNNLGIKHALENGAEYICILNNDVIVERNFLNILVNELQSDQSLGIVGPCICDYSLRNRIQSFGARINLLTGLAQGLYKGVEYDSLMLKKKEVDYLGGACFVARRSVFEKIGMIPENYFLFFEETEFCLKAKRSGFKLECIKSSKVYHKGSSTISKFAGLSYYFLNRNRVVFMRRNANTLQMSVFIIYVTIEALARIIIRREPVYIFKYYLEGLFADKNNIDLHKIEEFIKTN